MPQKSADVSPPRSDQLAKTRLQSLLDSPSRVTRSQVRRQSSAYKETTASPKPTRKKRSANVDDCSDADHDVEKLESLPSAINKNVSPPRTMSQPQTSRSRKTSCSLKEETQNKPLAFGRKISPKIQDVDCSSNATRRTRASSRASECGEVELITSRRTRSGSVSSSVASPARQTRGRRKLSPVPSLDSSVISISSSDVKEPAGSPFKAGPQIKDVSPVSRRTPSTPTSASKLSSGTKKKIVSSPFQSVDKESLSDTQTTCVDVTKSSTDHELHTPLKRKLFEEKASCLSAPPMLKPSSQKIAISRLSISPGKGQFSSNITGTTEKSMLKKGRRLSLRSRNSTSPFVVTTQLSTTDHQVSSQFHSSLNNTSSNTSPMKTCSSKENEKCLGKQSPMHGKSLGMRKSSELDSSFDSSRNSSTKDVESSFEGNTSSADVRHEQKKLNKFQISPNVIPSKPKMSLVTSKSESDSKDDEVNKVSPVKSPEAKRTPSHNVSQTSQINELSFGDTEFFNRENQNKSPYVTSSNSKPIIGNSAEVTVESSSEDEHDLLIEEGYDLPSVTLIPPKASPNIKRCTDKREQAGIGSTEKRSPQRHKTLGSENKPVDECSPALKICKGIEPADDLFSEKVSKARHSECTIVDGKQAPSNAALSQYALHSSCEIRLTPVDIETRSFSSIASEAASTVTQTKHSPGNSIVKTPPESLSEKKISPKKVTPTRKSTTVMITLDRSPVSSSKKEATPETESQIKHFAGNAAGNKSISSISDGSVSPGNALCGEADSANGSLKKTSSTRALLDVSKSRSSSAEYSVFSSPNLTSNILSLDSSGEDDSDSEGEIELLVIQENIKQSSGTNEILQDESNSESDQEKDSEAGSLVMSELSKTSNKSVTDSAQKLNDLISNAAPSKSLLHAASPVMFNEDISSDEEDFKLTGIEPDEGFSVDDESSSEDSPASAPSNAPLNAASVMHDKDFSSDEEDFKITCMKPGQGYTVGEKSNSEDSPATSSKTMSLKTINKSFNEVDVGEDSESNSSTIGSSPTVKKKQEEVEKTTKKEANQKNIKDGLENIAFNCTTKSSESDGFAARTYSSDADEDFIKTTKGFDCLLAELNSNTTEKLVKMSKREKKALKKEKKSILKSKQTENMVESLNTEKSLQIDAKLINRDTNSPKVSVKSDLRTENGEGEEKSIKKKKKKQKRITKSSETVISGSNLSDDNLCKHQKKSEKKNPSIGFGVPEVPKISSKGRNTTIHQKENIVSGDVNFVHIPGVSSRIKVIGEESKKRKLKAYPQDWELPMEKKNKLSAFAVYSNSEMNYGVITPQIVETKPAVVEETCPSELKPSCSSAGSLTSVKRKDGKSKKKKKKTSGVEAEKVCVKMSPMDLDGDDNPVKAKKLKKKSVTEIEGELKKKKKELKKASLFKVEDVSTIDGASYITDDACIVKALNKKKRKLGGGVKCDGNTDDIEEENETTELLRKKKKKKAKKLPVLVQAETGEDGTHSHQPIKKKKKKMISFVTQDLSDGDSHKHSKNIEHSKPPKIKRNKDLQPNTKLKVSKSCQDSDTEDAPTMLSFSAGRQEAFAENEAVAGCIKAQKERRKERAKQRQELRRAQKLEKLNDPKKIGEENMNTNTAGTGSMLGPISKQTDIFVAKASDFSKKRLPPEVLELLSELPPTKKMQKHGSKHGSFGQLTEDDVKQQRKREKKIAFKLAKQQAEHQEYIPLQSDSGATRFGVVPLRNIMSSKNKLGQEATSFRKDMLFGHRIKRTPIATYLAYEEKLKAASKNKF